MTKYNFQFQDEKDSLRPCRLVVLMFSPDRHLPFMHCVAVGDKCQGKLYDRPVWCPLTVVETIGDYLKGE